VCAREKRENREMRNFLENHSMLINLPLERLARRSLVAVRKYRNPIRSYGYGENTLYGRVFSVSVLKTGTFSLDQPTIYIGKQRSELIGAPLNFNLDSVEGIIVYSTSSTLSSCTPVFPYRIQGKLLFGLCRSCCETFSQVESTHDLSIDHEFI